MGYTTCSILAIEGLVHPLLLLQFGLPIWVVLQDLKLKNTSFA
jgi:hypothetical protein